MFSLGLLLVTLMGVAYALPQDCVTTTIEVIQPTKTWTYSSTDVVTEHPTTAEDFGTFTEIDTVSSTKTLMTLTSTTTACEVTAPAYRANNPPITVYTNASSSDTCTASPIMTKRALGLSPRQDAGCTVTVTTTTTYGETYTAVPAHKTSTFMEYTDFTETWTTQTTSKGTTYAIATAIATATGACINATAGDPTPTSTVTHDARCAPSALISAWQGHGLEWQSNTPLTGAHWTTTTEDGSQCCQLCAEQKSCAASSWDIRDNTCTLEFPVDFETGNMDCGEGLLAYADAGPNHPMAPGTGLFVAELCGNVVFGNAKPDDGT